MKLNKLLILLVMLGLILGIGCVSASDINDTNIIDDSDSTSSISNNKCNATNFRELNDFIKTHNVIELENDITRENNEEEIIINKDVTIDGKGHTINAKQNGRIFTVKSGTLTLNNLKLINGDKVRDGGAIYCEGKLKCINCSFKNNKANRDGGAIEISNSKEECVIINSTFEFNQAEQNGGAIESNGKLTFQSCKFYNNDAKDSGGAIYCLFDKLKCFNCNFISNTALRGGAIEGRSVIIFKSTFDNNVAKTLEGGAIKALFFVECTDSVFTNNHAYIDGGAIYANNDDVTVTSCLFDSNVADGSSKQCYGGAICGGDVKATNSKFINNMAYDYGGAIYSYHNVKVTNSYFENNEAKDNNGGAIYTDDNVECKNSVFINNRAKEWGGAIYCSDKINIYDSIFENNRVSVNQGGAVYCDESDVISNCTFNNNYAKEKGGAITIWKRCTTTVEDSKFTNNVADKGGAIYTDSRYHYIIIHHNIFINNRNMDVYATGHYKQIDHNYFGTPNPNFYGNPGIFVEWKRIGPNHKHADSTYFKTLEEYNNYDGSIDPDKHDNDSDTSNTINKSITMEPTGSPIIALLLAIFILPIVRFKK